MNVTDALSVSQLNGYVKALMEQDDFLKSVAVSGEISNFKRHSSGHIYFTLKDGQSEISAVMFRGAAQRLTFAPSDGMSVTVYGSVSVYEVSGRYQIYVGNMTGNGAGMLYEQFKRLYERLRSEGLFEESKKKKLPRFPKKIGIITSPTGAAVRDMINVTGRRYPSAEILICPALVQGAEAPDDLCRALAWLDGAGECDVIIIGRGGGSIEDLWAFNDERVVRAVAAANTPIISAVGHETDTTLCDYAADVRAPTPSAAAELAVPDRRELIQKADTAEERLDRAVKRIYGTYCSKLNAYERSLNATSPKARLKAMRDKTAQYGELIDVKLNAVLKDRRRRFEGAVGRLEGVNPMAVLKRGYGMAFDAEGRVISHIGDVAEDDEISVRVSDGYINARVSGKETADGD